MGVLLGAVGAVGMLRGLSPGLPLAPPTHASPASPDDEASTLTPSPAPDVTFTVVAGGDVLPHAPVNASARTPAGIDFAPLLAGTTPFISGADLALCHLEIPVGAPDQRYQGYPRFLAVSAIVPGIVGQGWDGCSTASNHAVDQGMAGVISTLDALRASGVGHAGTARTPEEVGQPQLYQLERGGRTITVAHIAAAYGTNGLPLPAQAPWVLQLIDVDQIVAQATQARLDGAGLVIVSIHAGAEYVTAPTATQRDMAARLGASGQVDLVIGHHAHVPQPIELVPGGPDGTGMWTAYGLGNYLSNQDEDCCVPATDSGLLLTATVTQPAGGPARVTGVEWTAITVDRLAGHRVRLLTDALADPSGGSLTVAQLQARYDRVRDAVGPQAMERTTAPVATGPPPTLIPPP